LREVVATDAGDGIELGEMAPDAVGGIEVLYRAA
jgi:hypothetical protein